MRVERPVPRWSGSSTRWVFSASTSHGGLPGAGRGDLPPGPPCRKTSSGNSSLRRAGSTTSRTNISITGPSPGLDQSSGTGTRWSRTCIVGIVYSAIGI